MVQTGDPSGTGQTCESIYGKEGYGTESHGRLQYRYGIGCGIGMELVTV